MKIRKVFESFKDYSIISTDGYNQVLTHNITDYVRDKIHSRFPKLKISHGLKGSFSCRFNGTHRRYGEYKIYISEDDDDYYYLSLTYRGGKNHPMRMWIFKCDQWYGLIECIEKEIF